ncbi:MAG: hypothetical protein IPP67_03690 [Rhodospirillaceae bacterium]|nr:hypothetical protein [Rhodospirillaceae bacterium]
MTTQGVTAYPYNVPTSISEMPLKSHSAVAVGGSDPLSGADIQDIFVQGDSVFMALAGFDNGNVGIFKSTAILNEQGFIVDWTPAGRVMVRCKKSIWRGA